jgi:hypothetical protein
MDFDEKLSWACGTVLIGIGSGEFRSAMAMVVLGINQEAFDRGVKSGLAQAKAKKKRRGA